MSTLIVNELDAAREAEYRIRMPSGAHLNIAGTLAVDNTAGSQSQIIFPKGNSAQRLLEWEELTLIFMVEDREKY